MRQVIERLCDGRSLARDEMQRVVETVLQGDCTPVVLAALLVAFKAKGECSEELAGAALAMRGHALAFPRPGYEFADCCGTGGDGAGTLNVSTAVALVLAECGLPVAKHGNRAISSRSGSADVLEALGMRLDVPPPVSRRMLDETGFCFLFAPQYHTGMAHAMPVRRELGVRTLFNLLGPLSHPAAPPVQLLGVYDAALCGMFAETLRSLGCTTALVVNGGIDEIALHRTTTAVLLRDGRLVHHEIEPRDFGLCERPLAAIAGGDVAHNAGILLQTLSGEAGGAYADMVAMNAGALLWATARADSLREGHAQARDALASGQALRRLWRVVECSHVD